MKKKREQVVEEDAPMDLVNAAKLPDAFLKKFLDLLQDKVANPENYPVGKITLGELNFLQKHRPELFAKPEKPKEVLPAYDKNDECESQQALAIRMAQHYTNPDGSNQLSIKINKRSIGNWIKLKTADCAKNPPPGCCNDAGTRFSLKAWIAWFDKFMWPTKRADGHRFPEVENKDPEQRIKDAEARIREAKADRTEKEYNDRWTLTTIAAQDGAGLGIAARNAARDMLENNLVPKVSMGLEIFIPDESGRMDFLDKLRRDGIELFNDFQNHYSLRAQEILTREIVSDDGNN